MITLYAAMLVTLGFLIAALIVVILLPAYRRRIERFTGETLKRSLPLTEAEIRADRDRLRAEFAMELHRREAKLEDAGLLAARQSVEVNRRDAKIQELTQAIADQKMSVEEHENARRVLEQAILDRLPKVEQRLLETRKLLASRDREIAQLVTSGGKQSEALEEATQLNSQREKELSQLRTTLETRAIRNRDVLGDTRVDGEVALRSELQALREKTREQAASVERLQAAAKASGQSDQKARDQDAEIKRLSAALAKTESELATLQIDEDSEDERRAVLEKRIADLEAAECASVTELAKLKAALKTYQGDFAAPAMAHKADLSALQAEVDEQRLTINALRAEISASQERLTRQAQLFRDELRQFGDRDEGDAEPAAAPRRSLADRIITPRPSRSADEAAKYVPGGETSETRATPPYLRAMNGNGNGNGHANGNDASEAAPAADQRPPPLPVASEQGAAAKPQQRRPRLLERISGIDKPN